jgi:hypothetical protein
MAIKEQLKALTQKEMDRKDFLKYVGGILLAVVGVTGLVRVLLGTHHTSSDVGVAESKNSGGYGSSTYGG